MSKPSTSLFQKFLKNIYEHFKKDTSEMLIVTGTLGWVLSSAAQILAISRSNKISKEKKSFLLPQEFMDAAVNVGGFLVTTLLFKKFISKLSTTGKFAPSKVREYINKKPEIKAKVGKVDLNLDEYIISKAPKDIEKSYLTYQNYIKTVGTVGASILSCNILTPYARNYAASKFQKEYIKNKTYYDTYSKPNDMKI